MAAEGGTKEGNGRRLGAVSALRQLPKSFDKLKRIL